ncbi:MAG: orotidine-5'-phosphate decarboxylase [Thermoguttaceae bacterium]|nr:orotidine-5'-phosphate decarboxylase [Thermoguttaceae bacterium]
MSTFIDQLRQRCHTCGNPVLVGLDPRLESLPPSIRPSAPKPSSESIAAAYNTFCRGVIDVVAPLVPAIKPQAAFFEEIGPAGMAVLAGLIPYAQSKGLLVILDGKRNDIGSTAAAYAAGLLGRNSPWHADALTVSPYLGEDSVQPFVDVAVEREAGIFVLVKTSNPGGAMLQDLTIGVSASNRDADTVKRENLASFAGRPVYERVAAFVNSLAESTRMEQQAGIRSPYGAVGAVVGATWPAQLAELRQQMPATWFLVPGFGAQGGTVADIAAAFDARGEGAVINNSRGILFAYKKSEYAEFGAARWERAVEAATRKMIDQLRTDTTAGRLGQS